MVVLETALAAGFGTILADYILHMDTTNTYSKGFLLVDVGTVFGWGIELLQTTYNLAFNLTEQMIAPVLMHRNESIDVNMLFDPIAIESTRIELSSHLNTYNGLNCILTALLQRKINSFSTSFGSNTSSLQVNNFEAINEHKKMINKIEKLIIEINTSTSILDTIILLFNHKSISLLPLISNINNENLTKLLLDIRLQRCQNNNDMLFLPTELCSRDCLYDILVRNLPLSLQLYAIIPYENSTQEDNNYKKIAMLLWLPLLCVQNIEINEDISRNDNER
jgi:hypothetical protein